MKKFEVSMFAPVTVWLDVEVEAEDKQAAEGVALAKAEDAADFEWEVAGTPEPHEIQVGKVEEIEEVEERRE